MGQVNLTAQPARPRAQLHPHIPSVSTAVPTPSPSPLLPSHMEQDDYIMGQQVGKGAFGTAHIVTHKVGHMGDMASRYHHFTT